MPLVSVVSILPLELSVPFGSSSWFFALSAACECLGLELVYRLQMLYGAFLRDVRHR